MPPCRPVCTRRVVAICQTTNATGADVVSVRWLLMLCVRTAIAIVIARCYMTLCSFIRQEPYAGPTVVCKPNEPLFADLRVPACVLCAVLLSGPGRCMYGMSTCCHTHRSTMMLPENARALVQAVGSSSCCVKVQTWTNSARPDACAPRTHCLEISDCAKHTCMNAVASGLSGLPSDMSSFWNSCLWECLARHLRQELEVWCAFCMLCAVTLA